MKGLKVLFIAFSVLIMSTAAHAITVSPGSVVDGEYSYIMNYDNYSRWYYDAETNINFSYRSWSDGTRFSWAYTGSFAQLVLHWDFSASGLAPNSVELFDRTTLFTNINRERTQAVVEYSINGTNWLEIDTQTTPNYPYTTTSQVNDDWTSVVLGLGTGSGVTDFYYRLTMTTLTDGCSSGDMSRCDSDGVFSSFQSQWSRVNPGVTTFNATFSSTVVPEPVSSILFIAGGVTLGFRRFKKKFMK